MLLRFRVTSMYLVDESRFPGPNDPTDGEPVETKEYTCLVLTRSPTGKSTGFEHRQVSVKLKDEDVPKYKLGQVVTFMSIDPASPDQGGDDYEAVANV